MVDPAARSDSRRLSVGGVEKRGLGLQGNRKEKAVELLLVEDVQIARKVAALALARAGFKPIDIACSGEEAIDKFKANSYRLVLMDIQLPRMSGTDATKAIRQHEQDSGAASRAVIFGLTSNVSLEDLQLYKSAEMNGCIAKGQLIAQSLVSGLAALKDDPGKFIFKGPMKLPQ